ncbi:MAG: hypothetical protein J6V64_03510 [Burkholderiaceae bacterium]|nr:hypothetical protein [Burkholderiaceae bacterium]
MFADRSSPIVASATAASKLPRVALLALLVAFICPGILTRDFWGSSELSAFATILTMINGSGIDWALPNILGKPDYLDTPLMLWCAALFAKLFGGLLGNEVAARLSILFFYTFTTGFIWYGTWYLARRDEAQPVALAFGKSASPRDYGRVVGDAALLLFIGTLGLFIPLRELDSEIGLICVTAAYIFGLGWALWHPKWGSLATGAAVGAAILASDLWLGLILFVTAIYIHCRAHAFIPQPLMPRLVCLVLSASAVFFVWPIAGVAFTIEMVDAWWLGWWQHQLALVDLPSSKDITWMLKNAFWFVWPVGPFMLGCLYAFRKQIGRTHIKLPLMVLAALCVWALFVRVSNESILMALIPPATILAGFGMMAARRSWSSLLDWFSACVFSLLLLALWLYYIAWHWGFPPKMYHSVFKLAPMVSPTFHGFWLAVCFAATLAWIALVMWRLNHDKSIAWRGPWLAAAGVSATAIITVGLFGDLIDGNRSMKPVAEHILADYKAQQGSAQCINADELDHEQIQYMRHWGLPLEKGQCEFKLVQTARVEQGAEVIGYYNRPRDRHGFILLKK